jgi:hypothetical protein
METWNREANRCSWISSSENLLMFIQKNSWRLQA